MRSASSRSAGRPARSSDLRGRVLAGPATARTAGIREGRSARRSRRHESHAVDDAPGVAPRGATRARGRADLPRRAVRAGHHALPAADPRRLLTRCRGTVSAPRLPRSDDCRRRVPAHPAVRAGRVLRSRRRRRGGGRRRARGSGRRAAPPAPGRRRPGPPGIHAGSPAVREPRRTYARRRGRQHRRRRQP